MKSTKNFLLIVAHMVCITSFLTCTKETAVSLARNKVGGDTSYYNKFIPPTKPNDELTFKLNWVLQKDTNLLIAKVDVAAPYSVDDIISVKARPLNADSIEIARFDSTLRQNLYYKTENGQLSLYKYYSGPPPKTDWENSQQAMIAALIFIAERVGFFEIKVKFEKIIIARQQVSGSYFEL